MKRISKGPKTAVKKMGPARGARSPKQKPIAKVVPYHHGNLRETLIQGALKFLETNPLEALSLNTLATRAGVSQAAPYRHFKNRNELLAAISQQGFELKFKYMLESYQKNKAHPLELFHGCAQAYFKMGLLHPQHFKLMLTSPVVPCEEYPELQKAAGLAFGLLKKTLEVCQEARIVGPGDLYHKSMHCWALVNGFTTLYAEGRLSWLGIDERNAKSALRKFVEQFRIGHQSPLQSDASFKLFSTTEAKGSLERLKMAEAAIEKMVQL